MHTGGLKRRFENSEIPPTGVGGLFKCNLQRKVSETVESPQRQLVDCSDPALHREAPQPYSPPMYLTPFTSLAWAYRLHYYLCFRTHRRRPVFTSKAAQLTEFVSEICARHDYHALEYQPRPDQFRCLLSLQPAQAICSAYCRLDLKNPPTSVGGISHFSYRRTN